MNRPQRWLVGILIGATAIATGAPTARQYINSSVEQASREDYDPRCDSAARYAAMREGVDCSYSHAPNKPKVIVVAPPKKKKVIEDVPLPYPCSVVLWYKQRYTSAQLKQMGKDNGVSLSAAQKAKIQKECFGKK